MRNTTICADKTLAAAARLGRSFLGGVTLVLVIVAAAATPAAAQVFNGDLTLSTQTQVDQFAYTKVTGFLRVQDDNDGIDPIKDVDGLSGLTSVGFFMQIAFNDSLTDVDGLSGLTSVASFLDIRDNDSLTDVDGLSGLTSVGSALVIGFNDSLMDVDGLSSLTWVGNFLQIAFNNSLTDVDGLSGLTSVGAALIIEDNDSLTDMDGVSGLTSVGGDLCIIENDSLTEYCGLFPLLDANGLGGTYDVSGNAANPTEQDILDGGPCDPADVLLKLYDKGAVNRGQAKALAQMASHSLVGLLNALDVFVDVGILSESEAQLLLVIASIP